MTGEDVLISGAGPIGIMAVAICKFSGSRNVVITDVNDYRLDLAVKLGATKAINPKKESLKDVFNELGINHGFDVGLEMSGNPEAFNQMIDKMYNGGNIALLGILPNSTKINSLSLGVSVLLSTVNRSKLNPDKVTSLPDISNTILRGFTLNSAVNPSPVSNKAVISRYEYVDEDETVNDLLIVVSVTPGLSGPKSYNVFFSVLDNTLFL